MINLLAIKAYEESRIAILDPTSQIRTWWNALPFDAQHEIAVRWFHGNDYQRDFASAKHEDSQYGDNL